MIRVPMDLLNAALSVSKNSYAPYSNFHVAASVRDDKGRLYTGVNVENSSYGLTMCAERVAVFNAVSHGSRRIREVLVLAMDSERPVPPCGACLQVLAEFGDDHTMIYMVSWKSGKIMAKKLGELLPARFSLKGRSKE